MGHIYTIDEIKEKLLPIFKREPIKRAVLFGSYAKGCAREKSDIDIFIDSEGKLNGWDYFGVLEDVSSSFGVSVDVIPECDVIKGGRIQREIAETGIVIYERV